MVLYGQASGPVLPLDLGALTRGSLFLTRPWLGAHAATREELLERANEVLGWVQSGELRLSLVSPFPWPRQRMPTASWKAARPPARFC